MSAKGGRPALGADKRRRNVLVKLTDQEHRAVTRAAIAKGKTLAGWFRDRGLRGLEVTR